MRRFLTIIVSVLALVGSTVAVTAAPAAAVGELSTAEEAQFLAQINDLRASRGAAPLQLLSTMTAAARDHTFAMAEAGQIYHTNSLSTGAPSGWTKLGENVGYGSGTTMLMNAFINSSGHLRNLVDPVFTHIGIGVVRNGGVIYTTHRFVAVAGSTPPADLPFTPPTTPSPTPTNPRTANGTETIGIIRGRDLLLRNSNTGGDADYTFSYGSDGDTLVFGDWDGNGTDTVGVRRGRDLFLRNSNTSGPANYVFSYGSPGDQLIFGDWDGNGTDTIGVVRGRNVYLRNSNTGGPADYVFAYGKPDDTLVWGDWDGNGTVTVGVQRGRDLMLRNSNTGGPADYVFSYGSEGDTILFGDWDGNGTDTIGIQRGNNVYLRNSNTGGPADTVFTYGKPGDTLVFGDWDGR